MDKDTDKEWILCAAIRRKSTRIGVYNREPYYNNDIMDIEIGYRHHDIMIRFHGEVDEHAQGFYTSKGRFVTREEAYQIAQDANQLNRESIHGVKGKLYSEDLY